MNTQHTIFWLICITLLVSACKDKETPKAETKNEQASAIFESTYSRFDIMQNDAYQWKTADTIDYNLREISGIVSSRKNNNVVYVHEDSGNGAVVFVYTKSGIFKGTLRLTGVTNRDWEDIAIGPGPIDGETYIYVGDIGDNGAIRASCRIYRFVEPIFSANDLTSTFAKNISDFDIIDYQYPDGARDAEALLIDQKSKDLILVSKRDPLVQVYSLPYPQKIGEMSTATFHGKLPLKRILAGDISADNTEILLKNDGTIYHWFTEEDDVVKTLFHQQPTALAYIPEEQGEAVGWDENGYFTISESRSSAAPVLYYYQRKP